MIVFNELSSIQIEGLTPKYPTFALDLRIAIGRLAARAVWIEEAGIICVLYGLS